MRGSGSSSGRSGRNGGRGKGKGTTQMNAMMSYGDTESPASHVAIEGKIIISNS